MEVAIIVTALIVCGTAWDITRRFTSHQAHVERLDQLSAQLQEAQGQIHAMSEQLVSLTIQVQTTSDSDPHEAIQELSDKLHQACAEWREVFATVDAKNDESRKEVLTRVAGLLQAVPRPGFNR